MKKELIVYNRSKNFIFITVANVADPVFSKGKDIIQYCIGPNQAMGLSMLGLELETGKKESEKEYEKLAREATEEYVDPKGNFNYDFEAGVKHGFLKAREMAIEIGNLEHRCVGDSFRDMGEKEV